MKTPLLESPTTDALQKLSREARQGDAVPLRELTPMEWDRVYFFREGAPRKEVVETVGADRCSPPKVPRSGCEPSHPRPTDSRWSEYLPPHHQRHRNPRAQQTRAADRRARIGQSEARAFRLR